MRRHHGKDEDPKGAGRKISNRVLPTESNYLDMLCPREKVRGRERNTLKKLFFGEKIELVNWRELDAFQFQAGKANGKGVMGSQGNGKIMKKYLGENFEAC